MVKSPDAGKRISCPNPREDWQITVARYIETVDRLASVLADHAQDGDDRGKLVPDFRASVHSVTVHPKPAREGFQVEVQGKLAALIGGDAFPQAK